MDYIITHTAPLSIIEAFCQPFEEIVLNCFLEEVKERTVFRQWFFGHVHKDITVNDHFHSGISDDSPYSLKNENLIILIHMP